jgi:hypothetical protein
MTPLENVLSRLYGARKQGDGWVALCPAHDDKVQSLSVTVGDDGRVLVHCHAGCDVNAIVGALGLTTADLFERAVQRVGRLLTQYPYTDEKRVVLFVVERREPKSFLQKRPDGAGGFVYNLHRVRRVPYRLPELLEGIKADRWVLIPEGEKDVDRLRTAGFVATCNAGGAGKWRSEWSRMFAGAKVAVLPDNDEVGRKHAATVARLLLEVAAEVRIVALPGLGDHGDVSDWMAGGGTAEQLKKLVSSAPTYADWARAAIGEVASSTLAVGGVSLVRASDISMEMVDYLHDPLIPLRVTTLVVGLDGVGKSTVLYTMAAQATRGLLPGHFRGVPVDAVIASSEDHPGSVIVPRLVAARADLDRVHIVKVRRDGLEGDISLPGDCEELARRVTDVGAKLLIVDPLVAHLPLHIDSHKAQHVRHALAPLARLAETAELAIACVVHFNGSASTDVRSRISGSKALRDASRSVIVCGADPTDPSRFVMVQDKNSFGPKPTTGYSYEIQTAYVERDGGTFKTSKVRWGEEVDADARAVLAGAPKERSTPQRDAAEKMLKQMLRDGPRLRTEIQEEALKRGISFGTVKTAKAVLGIIDWQRPEPGRRGAGPSRWALPNSGQRPPANGGQRDDCPPFIGPELATDAACSPEQINGGQHSRTPVHHSDETADGPEPTLDAVDLLVRKFDATIIDDDSDEILTIRKWNSGMDEVDTRTSRTDVGRAETLRHLARVRAAEHTE